MKATKKERPPYRDGDSRPVYRGAMMTRLLPIWPVFCILYVIACGVVSATINELTAIRILVAMSTTLSILCSHKYHNSDKLAPGDKAFEVFWLKCDFCGISAVLTSTFALWSAHFDFQLPFGMLTTASALGTSVCALAAFGLFERTGTSLAGEIIIKAVLGVQFILMFGYMVHEFLQTACSPHTIIWFTYLPGFVAYVSKLPKDGRTWGSHDVFHAFIVAGHLVSCTCDLVNCQWDCYSENLTTHTL